MLARFVCSVESDEPMAFHVDGEPRVGGTRLEAKVVPGALLVAARSQKSEVRSQ